MNAFDGLSRLDMTKERISELENIWIETSKTEKQKERTLNKKLEQSIQGLEDSFRRHNMRVIVIPQGEEKGRKHGHHGEEKEGIKDYIVLVLDFDAWEVALNLNFNLDEFHCKVGAFPSLSSCLHCDLVPIKSFFT